MKKKDRPPYPFRLMIPMTGKDTGSSLKLMFAPFEVDQIHSASIQRKRGERTKLIGSQLLEDVAVEMLRARKDSLRVAGVPTYDAWKRARKEVAALFRVKPSVLNDWYRKVPKRERAKPIEERSYRRYRRPSP